MKNHLNKAKLHFRNQNKKNLKIKLSLVQETPKIQKKRSNRLNRAEQI